MERGPAGSGSQRVEIDMSELEKILQRRGVQFSLLQNERLSADLVTQYLNVKRRQLI